MIKEIPILFSTPMVQAILEGRKTQTRRIVKFRNKKWRLSYEANEEGRTDLDAFGVLDNHGNLVEIEEGEPASLKELELCSYGKPGDIIWVRETWGVGCRPDPFDGSVDGIEFKADVKYIDEIESLPLHTVEGFEYANYEGSGWRPSIHMPKAIARIWLKVEIVRVERLQDISEEDAKNEGVELVDYYDIPKDGIQYCAHSYKEAFESLWKVINGADSWQANPWVWVVSFSVLSTTDKPSSLT